MTELLPRSSGPGHQSVSRLLDGLHGEGLELPLRVFVDCDDGDWRCDAAEVSAALRRKSVLVASSPASLLDAVRLEIGGAATLPISTSALREACEAAAESTGPELPTAASHGVLDVVAAGGAPAWVVGWRPARFWVHQVSAPRLIRALHGIARRIGSPAAIVPGPFLVVTGVDGADVSEVCRAEVTVGECLLPLSATVGALGDQVDPRSIAEARVHAVFEEDVCSSPAVPVLELPSGRRVGEWSIGEGLDPTGDGWTAVPDLAAAEPGVWDLHGDGDHGRVLECSLPTEIADLDQPVLRVPGWIGAAVRAGGPASLLVANLANAPERGNRPLWVPSVDAEGIRCLLSLTGPIWVDGPGVPRD